MKVLCKLTVVSFGEDAMPHFEKRRFTVCEEEVKGSDFCNLFVKACIVVAQRACRSSAFVCHRKIISWLLKFWFYHAACMWTYFTYEMYFCVSTLAHLQNISKIKNIDIIDKSSVALESLITYCTAARFDFASWRCHWMLHIFLALVHFHSSCHYQTSNQINLKTIETHLWFFKYNLIIHDSTFTLNHYNTNIFWCISKF